MTGASGLPFNGTVVRLSFDEPTPSDLFDRLSPVAGVAQCLPTNRLAARIQGLAKSGHDAERLDAYLAELDRRGHA